MRPINTEKSLRRYQILGFTSILLVVGALGGWAAKADINGAVVAPATITVKSYSKKVQHKEGGIVRKILVKDGDTVQEGQTLLVLDDTELEAQLEIIDALLLENWTKLARLEAQRDNTEDIKFSAEVLSHQDDPEVARVIAGQMKLFEATRATVNGKTNQLEQQIAQLEQQMEGLKAEAASKEEQIAFIAEELTAYRKLLKMGAIEKSKVLAMQREQARLTGERAELVAGTASTKARICEVKLQILQIREEDLAKTLSELRDVESKIAELRERRVAAASQLGRSVVIAPIAGDVYQVAVHTIGGVVGPGETLMLIVPQADELVLQAQVSPKDIDDIQVGQMAQVRFPAFGARMTPHVLAEVSQVSADTSRIDENSPPFYAVRLRIYLKELTKLGAHKLKPGMPAEAFIQTGARSPLSYLLKPLSDQITHAFRES
jgi:HlyD family secretion protein